jgi:hypothetical protein
MSRILLVLVALITIGTAAAAAPPTFNTLLAGGPIYGGLAQTAVVCYIFNGGVNPITLTNARIIEETGVSLTLTSNTCTGTLPAAGICSWRVTTILNNRAHACTILVNSVISQ